MSQSTVLYQSVILDHNRAPRGARALPDATHSAEGFNPICGDKILMTVKTENSRLIDLGFNSQSCALCRASASVLVDTLKGHTISEAKDIVRQFEAMLSGGDWRLGGDAEAFLAMRDFPARTKCVLLPWKTAVAAFSVSRADSEMNAGNLPTVTTEQIEGVN